jgi:hypothetical protein
VVITCVVSPAADHVACHRGHRRVIATRRA